MLKKVPMSRIRDKYQRVRIDRRILIAVLFLWIFSFLINVWPILFLTFFCVANAVLLMIDRYLQAPIDIELSTFSAILMTNVFGLGWGVAAAVMTKLAAIYHNKNIRVDHFFMIMGYVLAAYIASAFPSMNIVALGVIVVMLTNIYVFMVSKFITMLSIYEIFMYGSSNFIFNTVLFIGFSELFRDIMRMFAG